MGHHRLQLGRERQSCAQVAIERVIACFHCALAFEPGAHAASRRRVPGKARPHLTQRPLRDLTPTRTAGLLGVMQDNRCAQGFDLVGRGPHDEIDELTMALDLTLDPANFALQVLLEHQRKEARQSRHDEGISGSEGPVVVREKTPLWRCTRHGHFSIRKLNGEL